MEKDITLPQEVLDAQKRVRPLYELLDTRSKMENPLRTLIDECVQRARPADAPERVQNEV